MAQYNFLRTSFVAGEITPQAGGRTDISSYLSSCKTMRNFLPTYYGSATRTPGTKYIATVQDNNYASRLIPFEASDDATYLLEFSGDGTINILTDDGYVVDDRGLSNGDFSNGLVGWTQRNDGTGIVQFDISTQRPNFLGTTDNAARMYIPFTNPSVGTYTVTVDVYTNSITYRVGGEVGGNNLTEGTLTTGTSKTFTFTPQENDSIVYIEFESSTTSSIDNISLSSAVFRLNHPYAEEDLNDLAYAQYNDILYIVHKDYVPRRVVRRANNHWQIHFFDSSSTALPGDPSILYTEGPYLSLNTSATTVTMSGVSGTVTATSSTALFDPNDIGRLIRWRYEVEGIDSGSVSYAGNGTQKNFNFDFTISTSSDIVVYSVSNVGVYTLQTNPANYTVSGQQVVFGTAPAAGVTVVIQYGGVTGSNTWGYGRIVNYTSSTTVDVAVLSNFSKAATASTEWQLGAFAASVGYPKAVLFHEQRLWFGGTPLNPDLIFSSEVGDYLSFRPDSAALDGIVLSSSAMVLAAASGRLSKIEWLTSRVNLVVGTSSSLYELAPQDGIGLSATNLPSVLKRNENGTRDVVGLPIGTSVLYTNKSGNRLLEANYDLTIQSIVAKDISILSPDRFTSPILRMVYQDEPDSIVWLLKEDGTLTSCTYISDQQVRAFSEQTIAGTDTFIEDICVLRGTTRTDLYLVIRRTINGSTVRYIEKLMPRFLYQNLRQAWYVHSGLVTDQTQIASLSLSSTSGEITVTASGGFFETGDVGKYIKLIDSNTALVITEYINNTTVRATCYQTFPSTTVASGTWSISTTTVPGLSHLEGQSVTVFADGAWHNNKTVTSGSITLDRPAHYILVGLGYDSNLVTNDLAFEGPSGTAVGNVRKIRSVTANIYESVGGSIKTETGSSSQAIKVNDVLSNYNVGQEMFTGSLDLTIPSDFGLECRLKVDSSGPLPLTILGLVLKCEVGGTR